jgi:hypothetical protein
MTVTLREDLYAFMVTSRQIHLRMRNVSVRFVEKIKHILYSREFIRKPCRVRDSVDKILQPGRIPMVL